MLEHLKISPLLAHHQYPKPTMHNIIRHFNFPSHNNNNYYPQCIHVVTVLWITLDHLHALINPRRACAARVTVLGLCVCLSVCLSVDDYSRTTGYEAAYERYQQLQCYKGMKNNVAILLKRLRSRDMA